MHLLIPKLCKQDILNPSITWQLGSQSLRSAFYSHIDWGNKHETLKISVEECSSWQISLILIKPQKGYTLRLFICSILFKTKFSHESIQLLFSYKKSDPMIITCGIMLTPLCRKIPSRTFKFFYMTFQSFYKRRISSLITRTMTKFKISNNWYQVNIENHFLHLQYILGIILFKEICSSFLISSTQ